MEQKKLLMIVNPMAGRSKPRGPLFDAARIFCRADYLLSIRDTDAPGEATAIAAGEGAGGLNAVVQNRARHAQGGKDPLLHELLQRHARRSEGHFFPRRALPAVDNGGKTWYAFIL